MDAWILWGQRTRRWADSTCGDYRRRVGSWLGWCAANDVTARKATATDVNAWLDTLHPTPAVRSHAHTALLAWFDWQVAIGRARRNPVREVPRVPVRRTVPRSLDVAAIEAVLTAAHKAGTRWAVYVGLMLYAGLRRAEACHVRWVDLEGDDEWLRVTGKGGQEAIVPIHPALRTLIRAWRRQQTDPVWVFPGRDGPMSVATATKWLRRILDDAGLPGATGHWLRHSLGRRLVEVGVPVPDVMAALRHQSLSSTTIYTRARPQHVAAAIARLDY